MIGVTGFRTTIVSELQKLRPNDMIVRVEDDDSIPLQSHYVFAAGTIRPANILEQTHKEIAESFLVNAVTTVRLCEKILRNNPEARICIIGSLSGIHGCYDTTYALCKAAVHQYVKWRKVGPEQLLVCIAPPIIADAGMTTRRSDYPEILEKREHVYAKDVAYLVDKLLFGNQTGHWLEIMTGRNAPSSH